jgi:hypothetical protein
MGSPYNICSIVFHGIWKPNLPATDWQNIKAYSPDRKHLALIRWNAAGNYPGFHIFRIDIENRTYHKTKRMFGLCKKIYWNKGKFVCERD